MNIASAVLPRPFSLPHIRADRRSADVNFIWKVTGASDPNIRTITIISRNHPGIFSKIAGAFTLNGFDIVNARSYRQNNNMLDVFKVRAFPGQTFNEKMLAKAEDTLKAALAGRLNLSSEFKRRIPRSQAGTWKRGTFSDSRITSRNSPRVVINNDNSLLFSIIEIHSDDFPGLLYNVTDALFRCGVSIWIAKIFTSGDQVADTFYIKDEDGRKIESSLRIAAVKAAIENALKP